jgi:hypothetical protein
VNTTIKTSGELFRKAKGTDTSRPDRGWRSVFGLAEPKSVEVIDRIVSAELEQVDASGWDRSST